MAPLDKVPTKSLSGVVRTIGLSIFSKDCKTHKNSHDCWVCDKVALHASVFGQNRLEDLARYVN